MVQNNYLASISLSIYNLPQAFAGLAKHDAKAGTIYRNEPADTVQLTNVDCAFYKCLVRFATDLTVMNL